MTSRLSERELQYVLLAGENLSDKEIAARVGVTPRTVGNTLQRAYRKLGVSARKDAVRRVRSDYSQSTILIPPNLERPADRSVAADAMTGSAADRTGVSERLFSAYSGLGRWRLPPRWGGRRIGPIVFWTVALVLAMGVVSQSLRSCAELVDMARGAA